MMKSARSLGGMLPRNTYLNVGLTDVLVPGTSQIYLKTYNLFIQWFRFKVQYDILQIRLNDIIR